MRIYNWLGGIGVHIPPIHIDAEKVKKLLKSEKCFKIRHRTMSHQCRTMVRTFRTPFRSIPEYFYLFLPFFLLLISSRVPGFFPNFGPHLASDNKNRRFS